MTRERAQSFLTDDHIEHIVKAYEKFNDEPDLARVATLKEVRQRDGNLNIAMYVAPLAPTTGANGAATGGSMAESLVAWLTSAADVRSALDGVLDEKLEPAELPAPSTVVSELPAWLTRSACRQLPLPLQKSNFGQREFARVVKLAKARPIRGP